MTIQSLDWDSNHFDKNIGIIYVSHLSTEIHKSILKQKKEFDLVYVFSNSFDNTLPNPINTKQYYLAHASDVATISENNIKLIGKDYFQDIFNLALIAGRFSRFKLDPNFDDTTFHSLYRKWVENSFSRNHLIFGYMEEKKVLGMISLKFEPFNNIANIELIGVHPNAQGKQIGSKLISACMDYITTHSNMTYISVQTQKENQLACQFYEKCGFKSQNFSNIHHIWTK